MCIRDRASAWAETVQNAPLPSVQVGTRHGNNRVIDDLGVSWKISLPSSSPEVFCGKRRVDGPYWPAGWQTRRWMVEDVLVNRNMRFALEIVNEVCVQWYPVISRDFRPKLWPHNMILSHCRPNQRKMLLSSITENNRYMYCIIHFTKLSGIFLPELGGMHHLKQVQEQKGK